MINLKHIVNNDELNRASMNLPQNLICHYQSDYNNPECNVCLMPHSRDEQIFMDLDDCCSDSNNDLDYASIRFTAFKQKTDIYLDLSKVALDYKYVEVWKFNHIGEVLDFFVARNKRGIPDVLFGYSMETDPKAIHTNVHIGTFARIDEKDWKFYPKMKTTKETLLQVLARYTDL